MFEINQSSDESVLNEIYLPCFRKRRDTVDGALLSTSRFDNARFHPLVILLDTALNGTVDEVQDILPRVCTLKHCIT